MINPRSFLVFFLVIGVKFCLSAQCNFTVPITVLNPIDNDTYCPNDSVKLTTDEFDSYQWFYNVSSNSNQGGTPFPSGNTKTISVPANIYALAYFYVVGTKDNCTAPSDTHFWDSWVFAPIAIQSSGQSTLCEGETTLINNAFPGPSIFQWYKNGAAIEGATTAEYEVSEPGTYTLEAAYALCPTFFLTSGTGPTFSFMEATLPTITQTGNVLTASSGSNFQWFFNGSPIQGENNSTINAPALGEYQVSVTDVNGCEVMSDPFTILVLSDEELKALALEIFPNPVVDVFQIKNEKQQTFDLQIFDLQGRMVFSKKNNLDPVVSISTTNWDSGVYFVNILLEGESVGYKLVKN